MLRIGFRTIDGDVEFFAITARGMHVSGRGRDGLDKVIGAIVFYDARGILLQHFLSIEELWNGTLAHGLTVEGYFGELGFEATALFMTEDPSKKRRFLEFGGAVKHLARMSRSRKPNEPNPHP